VALIPRQTVASDDETQGTPHAVRHRVKLLVVVAVLAGCASSPRATCGADWTALSRDRGVPKLDVGARPTMFIDHVHIIGVDERLANALRAELQTRAGTVLEDAPLREDLRRLWKLGVIEDAAITADEGELTFVLTPRRTITNVVRKGGDKLAQSRFRRLESAPFEPSRIWRMAEALQQSYVREGRLDAQVEARQRVHATGVEICVATNPGPRITIAKLEFPGAKAVPPKTLMKVLRGMEANLNRPGGTLDEAALAYDELLIRVEYWESGHLDVWIGQPKISRHGKRIHVAIPIDEGPSYRLGTITAPIEVELRSGARFRRSDVVKAMNHLQTELGVEVYPQSQMDKAARRVDISFQVEWRYPWDALRFWLQSSR
jgi:outer membrane protein assembly factor BamA